MPPPRFTCGESPSEGCGDCKNDPTPGMVRSSSVLEDDRPEVVLSNGDDGGKIKRRGVASGATLEGARLGPTVLGLAWCGRAGDEYGGWPRFENDCVRPT